MSKDVQYILKAAKELQRPPTKSWFSKLPAEAQKRLLAIKEAYQDGRFAGVAMVVVYQAVVALLKENKWAAPKSIDTMTRWLRSTDTST